MPAETKERRQPRPKEEEASAVDPQRIGETLGWKIKDPLEHSTRVFWCFEGPTYNLNYTKTGEDFYSIGFTQVLDDTVVDVHFMGIKTIEFNKAQQTIRLKTSSEHMIIRGDGQVDGDANIHIAKRKPKH